MEWFGDFGWFLRDMYRHWVGKLTATLSILLAISPLVRPDFFSGNKGLIHTQWAWWIASAFAFFIASRLAWDEQRTKRIEAEQRAVNAEKKLEDERPKLGITAHSTEGPKAWEQHPMPLVLTIQRLGGRIPTGIRFDPVSSKNGRYLLQFDPLAHIYSSPQESGIGFEVIENGAPQLSASDWEKTRPYQKELLGLFLDNSPMELITLDYILTAHFLDGTESRDQRFTLTFDKQRWRFLINPQV